MIKALVSLVAIVIAYLILRSEGGSGANIRFMIPSYSTPEGKRIWPKLLVVFILLITAFVIDTSIELSYKDGLAFIICELLAGVFVTYFFRSQQHK